MAKAPQDLIPTMDESIRQRLLLVHDELISAASTEGHALAAFQTTWSTLHSDIDQAISLHSLSEETMQLVHNTASIVEILAEGFLDMNVQCESLTSKWESDVEDIFAHVSLTDTPIPDGKARPPSKSSCLVDVAPPSDYSQGLSYIAPAYKWLLKHLHDPYPSDETKMSIAKTNGTSLKHINSWFINVRRRMGWTALAKKFYMGSRSETIEAARRALVEEDPTLPSDVTIAFVELKYKARGLYSDKLKKSVLAGKLDVVVKDMTDEDREKRGQLKAQAVEDAKKQREADKKTRRLERVKERAARKAEVLARMSYPSPDRSSYTSPEPTRSTEDDTRPEIVASRKRGVSPSSGDSDPDVPITRYHLPNKRFRMDHSSSGIFLDMSASGLPSPQSSSEDLLTSESGEPTYPSETSPILPSPQSSSKDLFAFKSRELTSTSETVPITPSSLTTSRKRRLSDADTQFTSKRPRGLAVGPRHQAVSDPLPVSSAAAVIDASEFDSWFQGVFDIPSPVTAGDLDPSVLVDVELFKDWSLVDNGQLVEPSTTQKYVTPQQVELLGSELQPVTPAVFDMSMFPVPFGDDQFNFGQPPGRDFNQSANFCRTANGDAIHLQTHGTSENVTTSPTIHQFDFLDFGASQAAGHSDSQSTPFGEDLFNVEGPLSSICGATQSLQLVPATLPSFTSSQSEHCAMGHPWPQSVASEPFTLAGALNDGSTEALLDQIELPNINMDPSLLAILSFPPSDILAQSTQTYEGSQLNAGKQAKLERLRAYQEAVRELEAELSI